MSEIMTLDQAKLVLQELNQRKRLYIPDLIDHSFPKQKAFVQDKSPLQSALCTRRSGKSIADGFKLFRGALAIPGSTALYVGLTRGAAKDIMWRDVIKFLADKYHIECEFNEADLKCKLPNKSDIKLVGADVSYKDMEKLLGGKPSVVILDEAGSFQIDLKMLVHEILEPALADHGSPLAMTGTPTRFLDTLFHNVTEGIVAGWSNHRWNTFDNPYMAVKWAKYIANIEAREPDWREKPAYQRMILGKWVLEDSDKVYRYDPSKNKIAEFPLGKSHHTILGVDLGFEDPTAFCAISYDPNISKHAYVRETFKKQHMDVTDVGNLLKHWVAKYKPVKVVIDNASKQVVEELKRRWGLNLIAAEKIGKEGFIEILNSEMKCSNILIVGDQPDFETELMKLIWDKTHKDKGKRVEHANYDNHLCFTAGHKITTQTGWNYIEHVQVGDYVKTRSGYRPVTHQMYRQATVIEVTLRNGKSFTCTKDHPFWVEGESWVKAKNLLGKKLTKEKFKNTKVKNSLGAKVKDILNRIIFGCIDTFGKWKKD